MILVPAFVYLLHIDSTKARGTSLCCILPMVLTSSFFYYKGNFIGLENCYILCYWRKRRWIYRSKIIKKSARENFENNFYSIFNLCIL